MQLGFKQKGGETDRMNERQTERERELVSLLCGGLDTDLQHLLSLIPANQKQEYEPLSSTYTSQDTHILISLAVGSNALQ